MASNVSIDILVNDEGVGCLVSDRKPTKPVEKVTFDEKESRLAMVFTDKTKFPMEHKVMPEIAERLLKMKQISIIVVKKDVPELFAQVPFEILK